MHTRLQFSGEVMLLGWADTSSRGKTVTFQLHPDETGEGHPFRDFGTGKTGQRFALVAVPITDDESPSPAAVGNGARTPALDDTAPSPPPSVADKGGRSKRPFHTLPLSQQCAIRCGEEAFGNWMTGTPRGALAHTLPDDVAGAVRVRLGIKSRAELDTNEQAAAKWRALVTQFESDTGRLPERRG